MTTATKTPMCCGQAAKGEKKSDVFVFRCQKCGKSAQGKTPAEAAAAWESTQGGRQPQAAQTPDVIVPAIPQGPQQLQAWASAHMGELVKASAAFIEKPATERMIAKNINYAARTLPAKVWESEEGRNSAIEALKESFYYGATMPDMGSLITFGAADVEFVPAIEAFDFALTTGKNAPFEWIAIEPVHKNDKRQVFRKDGNFHADFEYIPNDRGPVEAIVVYGYEQKRKRIVGELYEKARLLEKAEAHSSSYRYYLQDMALVNYARSEGTIKAENGREYAEKTTQKEDNKYFQQDVDAFRESEKAGTLKSDSQGEYCVREVPKKGGGTWPKKVYRKEVDNPGVEIKRLYLDEMHNPYEGGDQVEMLRKAAGKTFFRPWMKQRNSMEMAGEWTEEELADDSTDTVIDQAIGRAKEQVRPDSAREPALKQQEGIKDAEFEVEEPEAPQPPSPGKFDGR
ncbi:MAG: hypothetical protein CVV44_04175 [Spirochaetae bacterium HGW-Spirochaetae-1]|jgi:hypothetical protein|nr:MAG: hypothetical protein CVV44_04175 [Spirochaetae bacterium HGW-Spirochaetae-1]